MLNDTVRVDVVLNILTFFAIFPYDRRHRGEENKKK